MQALQEAATDYSQALLPPTDPQCVYQLSLGFAKLTRVPALSVLPNLRALQLNNNSLAGIEGLSALVSHSSLPAPKHISHCGV